MVRGNYKTARFRHVFASDILRLEDNLCERMKHPNENVIKFSVSGIVVVKRFTFNLRFHQRFSLITFFIFSIDSSSESSVVSTVMASGAALSGAIARLESL